MVEQETKLGLTGFGRKNPGKVHGVLKEVEHRLRHPEFYRRHGCCLSEGLWNDAGS